MQEAVLSSLAHWQNFYVIIGSAAATLTGLMFVVITLIMGVRGRVSSSNGALGAFGTPNIVHFGAALLVAGILNAPWQALWNVALLLGILGLGGVSYLIIILLRTLRQKDYQPVLEDWLWHILFPFLSYATFLVAAFLLPGYPTPTLFAIAAGTMLLLFIGIHNAWDSVTYTVTEFAQPPDKNQDEQPNNEVEEARTPTPPSSPIPN